MEGDRDRVIMLTIPGYYNSPSLFHIYIAHFFLLREEKRKEGKGILSYTHMYMPFPFSMTYVLSSVYEYTLCIYIFC